MKFYCATFNGINDELIKKIGPSNLVKPRDADVWCFWQDVRGSFQDLLQAAQATGQAKPTFVVQHGRGATIDYGEPHNFPLLADWFLCWGKSDYNNLVRFGYASKAHIVGCPLNRGIKPKISHKEKVVLFVPVNTGKEEPENIAVYYELLKIKYDKAKLKVLDQSATLSEKWGLNGKNNVSFNDIGGGFDVVAKLLPWHDKNLYHGNVIHGNQYVGKNNELVFNLLRNVDLVVGVDEGCTEVFAYAHDVPVIVVDGFKYKSDFKDKSIDIHRTKAATHVQLADLKDAIEAELANPDRLKHERAEIAEYEMGLSYGNPTENIYRFIKDQVKCLSLK